MPFVVVELLLADEVMQEATGQLIVKLRFSKLLKFVLVLAAAPALTRSNWTSLNVSAAEATPVISGSAATPISNLFIEASSQMSPFDWKCQGQRLKNTAGFTLAFMPAAQFAPLLLSPHKQPHLQKMLPPPPMQGCRGRSQLRGIVGID